MQRSSTERLSKNIRLRFRKLNPDLGLPSEQVLLELFDRHNEELLAFYIPFQDFRYGNFLYFTLASNEYLNNAPLPRFLKIEFRTRSYESKSLGLAEGLMKTYRTMKMLLEHSFVSDSPVDILLEEEDLERWGSLEIEV